MGEVRYTESAAYRRKFSAVFQKNDRLYFSKELESKFFKNFSEIPLATFPLNNFCWYFRLKPFQNLTITRFHSSDYLSELNESEAGQVKPDDDALSRFSTFALGGSNGTVCWHHLPGTFSDLVNKVGGWQGWIGWGEVSQFLRKSVALIRETIERR